MSSLPELGEHARAKHIDCGNTWPRSTGRVTHNSAEHERYQLYGLHKQTDAVIALAVESLPPSSTSRHQTPSATARDYNIFSQILLFGRP